MKKLITLILIGFLFTSCCEPYKIKAIVNSSNKEETLINSYKNDELLSKKIKYNITHLSDSHVVVHKTRKLYDVGDTITIERCKLIHMFDPKKDTLHFFGKIHSIKNK